MIDFILLNLEMCLLCMICCDINSPYNEEDNYKQQESKNDSPKKKLI